ncbi:MAG: glycosyltransferase family 2 protein [Candidatus Promineifilaceae bacterium]
MIALQILFWLSITIVSYTMFGYPLLSALAARLCQRPVRWKPIYPAVSVIIPAYNEDLVIEAKIKNTLELDYPADKLEIVVAADGSDDRTVKLASGYTGVLVLHQIERRGKAAALNRAVPYAQGDIIVFTDANASLNKGALIAIAGSFADPQVGGVAGEKKVIGREEGLYWRYESSLKQSESTIGSVVGAAGEIFAFRKTAFIPMDEDAIIEDFLMSVRLVESGWRVVYAPDAVASEYAPQNLKQDWNRRVRIAAGGFQSIQRLAHMLNPRQGLFAWQFFSHRVLRWAVAPFMLPLALILNFFLSTKRSYKLLLIAQVLFYGIALIGLVRRDSRPKSTLVGAIYYFCLANLAAIVGFFRYITGQQQVPWKKVR